MADEPQYSSGPDAGSNKRKYDDQTPPSSGGRRATGFSSIPDSVHPSYNSVPPPLDGIEMAKQRAQEIAARLTLSAASAGAETKRPRVENGSGGGFDNDKGFSSAPSVNTDIKPMSNSAPSAIPVSYGSYHGTSKKIDVPQIRVGVIIGKAGETIKYLQLQSGAKIQVQRDMDADPNSVTRPVELTGTAEQIAKAEQLINDVLAEAEAGGSGIVSRRLTGHAGSEHFEMKIPNNKVGLVIGKGGETIKNMQARTGARIQVIPLHLPPGDTSTERTLHIDGSSEQIKNARELVDEVISENRMRNPAMAGGYPQQGYQARPPTSWGQGPPPMQQPGYGYMQPGAYPGPSPQYNMSQPPYGGYPSQPSSGGYASGWDQSAVPPNQQSSAASGYDYYNQQSSQPQQTPGGSTAPADNSGYNYSQPPASSYMQPGQGYAQDGYGGYHAPPQSGYGQQSSYDQQQGYGSAPSYGNAMNPTQEGHTPSYAGQGDSGQAPTSTQPPAMGQQGYNTSQQPSPNPVSYPPQGGTQPSYGIPPTSQTGYGPGYGPPPVQKPLANPPVYGQTQQSPTTPGSYGQPGYHSQPPSSGYGQPETGSQRAQSSSYGATSAQPGYGPPPYGAPYNTSYGGSYSQAPAYPADSNASGSARGTYEATPASQTAQQGGVAKASPQS
ncbi:far upstream element-binding protein 1-like isoform X2 [Durio zibethinus]|uniref:Far upstream element-binding protein 1-like isoform X2 n=1 Tax=Durio zibethinus TaxID=66656 RepID=A0A6P5XKZ7_DURZI|nr:far upstream element-binding protein 1-like isoform X2 [Durio zibethinus]